MRCTNNIANRCIILVICLSLLLSGCSSKSYEIPYNLDTTNDSYLINSGANNTENVKFFAQNLCVTENDLNSIGILIDESEAGGLFDVTTSETIFAKNVHKRMNPASLTKVMTAYLALKYGNLDDVLTASSNVKITESGATLIGINAGDKMTLSQALHALLIYSANDAAVMIAEYLSGSVEGFADVMNKEAALIGATNTHFVNPHGLTNEDHYTTAYDLYLIFNEAIKYDEFRKIINTKEYTLSYKNSEGNTKNFEMINTNKYINNEIDIPENITVIGGKTGTTNAAGSCLIMVANGYDEHTYISIILHSVDHNTLYQNMTELLNNI